MYRSDQFIRVEVESNLESMKKGMEKQCAVAMSRAINDALKRGKTAAATAIREVYAVKKKADVADNTTVQTCYAGDLEKGQLTIQSTRFTSVHFPFSPQKYVSRKMTKDENGRKKKPKIQTAKLTVKKGAKKTLPHAFVVNPNAPTLRGSVPVMLWHRYDSEGHIRPIKSLSVAQMARNAKVQKAITETMSEQYEKRLEHHMSRLIKEE